MEGVSLVFSDIKLLELGIDGLGIILLTELNYSFHRFLLQLLGGILRNKMYPSDLKVVGLA